jgi:hypothetical protein
MTRTKLEFAKILAGTMYPDETAEVNLARAEKFAAEMTLRKLCHEIEKAEEPKVPEPKAAPKVEETPKKKTRSLWSFLSLEDSDDE